jgi:hypothetical protein
VKRRRHQTRVVLLQAVCVACAEVASAGPPLQTDDPDTPGDGKWEINFATELERRDETWTWVPLLDINYGLGERGQLKIKPRGIVLDELGKSARSGAGNLQMGLKWRFVDEAKHGFAVSIYPQVDLNPPTESHTRGLVDEGSDFVLPVQLGRTLGDAKLYGEIGYAWREFRDDGFFAGVAVEYPTRSPVRWVGEIRFVTEGAFGDGELLANAGLKARLSDYATLLASIGHTLRPAEDESDALFSYLGLQLMF